MHIALWAYICRYTLAPGSDHWFVFCCASDLVVLSPRLSVASREDEEGTQRLLSSGGRWRCSAVTRSLRPRDVGTWVSWTWGRSVGWDLVEKRRGATTSGGQVADPSTQGAVGSHQVPASQWPLVPWLLLLPGVQGDGRRIWVWVLKFLGERLCSGSCLNVPQAGSRPASSLWYKGLAIYCEDQRASVFLSEGDEEGGGGGVCVLKTGKRVTAHSEVLRKMLWV